MWSKTLVVLLEITADRTPQHLLLPVVAVLPPNRTFTNPQEFRQLFFRVFAHVVPFTLTLVARLAEMGVSPAEPLSNATAEFTLELDEVFSMLRAVIYRDLTTIWADKLFGIEGSTALGLVHRSHTVLPSSEIRSLAFEALEISINRCSVLLWLPEVGRTFILQFLIVLLELFELQTFHGHLLYVLSEYSKFLSHLEELTIRCNSNPFFTKGTEAEVEEDSRGQPFYLESFLQAFHMEDVSASAHHAGCGWERLHIADSAVLICIDAFECFFVGLGALLGKAGHAFGFSSITVARVPAGIDFRAGLPRWFLAFLSTADISQGTLVRLEEVLLR